MLTIEYLYSKFIKKILRGKSVLNSKVDPLAKIYSGSEFYNSSIGHYSYVGYDCEIHNCDIGAFCSIANNLIVGGAQHPMDWVSTSPVFYNVSGGSGHHLGNNTLPPDKRTTIENDVWIGSRVIIMQGVHIGNGAVVGAGSVVTKDVPPYAVVAGVPAKIIKYRFPDDKIERLQSSAWWTLSDDKLRSLNKFITNPDLFIENLIELQSSHND